MATKERLAAMAASRCAVCSGAMVVKLVAPDPTDRALELRTYGCAGAATVRPTVWKAAIREHSAQTPQRLQEPTFVAATLSLQAPVRLQAHGRLRPRSSVI